MYYDTNTLYAEHRFLFDKHVLCDDEYENNVRVKLTQNTDTRDIPNRPLSLFSLTFGFTFYYLFIIFKIFN